MTRKYVTSYLNAPFYKSPVVKETCLKITSLAQLILCTPVYFNFFKTGMTCRVVFKSPAAAAATAAGY